MKTLTLKQARLLAGYTQEKISKLLEISIPTYIKFEKHPEMMSVQTAVNISKILEQPINLFFINSDHNKNTKED